MIEGRIHPYLVLLFISLINSVVMYIYEPMKTIWVNGIVFSILYGTVLTYSFLKKTNIIISEINHYFVGFCLIYGIVFYNEGSEQISTMLKVFMSICLFSFAMMEIKAIKEILNESIFMKEFGIKPTSVYVRRGDVKYILDFITRKNVGKEYLVNYEKTEYIHNGLKFNKEGLILSDTKTIGYNKIKEYLKASGISIESLTKEDSITIEMMEI